MTCLQVKTSRIPGYQREVSAQIIVNKDFQAYSTVAQFNISFLTIENITKTNCQYEL